MGKPPPSMGRPSAAEGRETFPTRLFALFFVSYAGQAVYTTYINLYLNEQGLTESQIGVTVSVSTAAVLAAELFWGRASDRAPTRNQVLQLLFTASVLVSLAFYLHSSFGFLVLAVTIFSCFLNPISPLQDNLALERLENTRWDYSQIRVGGTIGYCATVLLAGILLRDEYRPIFWVCSLCMAVCRLLCIGLPQVRAGRPREQQPSWRELLNNRSLVGLFLFNLAFFTGINFYHNFYPIYYTSAAVGGNSSMVGTMMFLSSASEIPMLLCIHRIAQKLGLRRTLAAAGTVTALRWLLLAFLRDPLPVLLVNLLHGFGYTSFNYCIVTYIGRTVPRPLRATGQTVNALIGNIGSKVLFGFLGGAASEWLGTDRIMLVSAGLMAAATLLFVQWSRRIPEFELTNT